MLEGANVLEPTANAATFGRPHRVRQDGADPHSRSLSRRTRIRAAHRGRPRAATPHRVIGAALVVAALAPQAASATPLDGPSIRTAAVETRTIAQVRAALVTEALKHRGIPYVWGGSTPAGFDCSGFTSYVYAKFGVKMAHSTYAQYGEYRHVARRDLRAGDLVFFAGLGHVGIYIGKGRFIHSPRSGKSVEVQRLSTGWYTRSYVGAVRPPLRTAAA